MRTVRAHIDLPGVRISDAEALWYDRRRWPAFVEGLKVVTATEGEPPSAGSVVRWISVAGGRGEVEERCVAYEARVGQELEVTDTAIRGVQRVRFAALPGEDGGVQVALELEYELLRRTMITPFTDLFFIRRAQEASLRRTLLRFWRELAEELELRREAEAEAAEPPAGA